MSAREGKTTLSDAISAAVSEVLDDDELDTSEGEESGTFPKRHSTPREGQQGSDEIEIVNRTARRIRIERRVGDGLVLGPFGLTRITRAVLAELELRIWLERGYVIVREPRVGDQPPVEPTTIAGALLIAGATVILQAVFTETALPSVVGIVLFAWTITPEIARWLEWRRRADATPLSAVMGRARDRFWRGLGMLVVCVTGFGLPVGVMFIQSGLPLAALREQPLRAMGFLGLFSCFVGSAATLPAMLFFLFAEQRRDVMRAQFHRDILRLDPALRTVGETERAYAPLLAEALCMRRGPLFFGPIVLSTFLLALGWVVTVLPRHADIQRALAKLDGGVSASQLPIELCALFVPNPTAFTFAFLGTYFFALNMVFRRYVRADLGPKAYSHIAVRIIIASVLAWVASQTWEGLRDPLPAAARVVAGAAASAAPAASATTTAAPTSTSATPTGTAGGAAAGAAPAPGASAGTSAAPGSPATTSAGTAPSASAPPAPAPAAPVAGPAGSAPVDPVLTLLGATPGVDPRVPAQPTAPAAPVPGSTSPAAGAAPAVAGSATAPTGAAPPVRGAGAASAAGPGATPPGATPPGSTPPGAAPPGSTPPGFSSASAATPAPPTPPAPVATASAPSPADGVSPWHLLLLAFFIGFVPDTGLTILHGVLKNRWFSAVIPALDNRDPLTQLEGITLYDQARLLEEGIENIENLCHHNLIELLLRTRIPAPRLVDLVDQGILYLHARDAAALADSNTTNGAASRTLLKLKSLGVRTATDFEQTFRHHTARVALMHAFGDDASRLRLIAFALEDDEWMPQLRSWREFRRTYDTIYTAAELEQTGAPRQPGVSIPPPSTPGSTPPVV